MADKWTLLAPRVSLVVFGVAAALTAKTVVDLVQLRRRFPPWFVPSFTVGMIGLVGWATYTEMLIQRGRGGSSSGRPLVWPLLALSFVTTTSVHQYYPFRTPTGESYLELATHLVTAVNGALAFIGVGGALALGWLYRRGHREVAIAGVALLGALMFIPNDVCRNPFNFWWLRTIGVSPLMYVPGMYATIFAVAALRGIQPRLNALALAVICVATAILGVGHLDHVIW